MSSLMHDDLDAARNLAVACLLLFLTGSLYSLGVFNEAVEQSSKVPEAFDGIWASSMVWMSLSGMPSMFLTGVAMSDGEELGDNDGPPAYSSKTHRIRLLVAIGSLSFLMMALAAVGVMRDNSFLVFAGIVLQGIAFGIFYLVSIELLAAWMPTRAGLAVGIGQMCFGFGSIVFTSFFEYLVRHFPCSTGILITTATLTIPSALCIGLMEWPAPQHPVEEDLNETTVKDEYDHFVVSWRRLPFMLSFWYYVAATFSGQAGYAFIPYFFKIATTFGKSTDVIVKSFQVVILFSTISRPFIGMLADCLKWGHGFFMIGSKNVMMMLLVLQLGSFLGLVSFSHSVNFAGFVVCSCAILVVFAGSALECAVLARDIFTPANSSLVFGVGASIAMGLGEFGSGELMSIIDSASTLKGSGPSRYNSFYVLSAGLSIFGLLSCAMLRRYAPHCPNCFANSEVRSIGMIDSIPEERKSFLGSPDPLRSFYSAVP